MIEFLVPYYGAPGLAIEALESVRAQTSDRWRVMVLDDAHPTSEVRDWITRSGDERIGYLRNETNLGAGGNFRKALSVATAEHVAFLGCDDRLLPRYVERVSELMDEPGVVAVQPGVSVIDAAGVACSPRADRLKRRLRPPSGLQGGERLATSLLNGNWTYFPSITWRLDRLRAIGFRQYDVVQDLALLLDLLLVDGVVRLDDEVVFEYRRHGAALSSRSARTGVRFAEERHLLSAIAEELADRGWSSAARAARLRWTSRAHAVSLAPGAVADRDWPAVRELMRHGMGS